MYCPRLDHFVRFNPNGTLGRCGHMVNAPQFDTLEQMDSSAWLTDIKSKPDTWPKECIRCQQTEQINNTSIRLNAIEFGKKQTRSDYLIVGGVLDNICNSACQSCNQSLSTKIGSLISNDYPIIDNSIAFWQLPLDRVVHLDINGGEPSASKNYRNILKNIPPSVTSVRINTNCSMVIPEIQQLLDRDVHLTVTVSLDGIGRVHDYVRWPIKWENFERNLDIYRNMGIQELNTWTTVSSLNIGDLKNIFMYTKTQGLDHSWALLEQPSVLSVKYSNHFTRTADVPDELKSIVGKDKDNSVELQLWTYQQDQLRGIKLWDFYKNV
jgi:sulfatase maturation enzyme AslB (radical SAM superfamily)